MKAVVLVSGGLDSATLLYWARARGWRPLPLAFRYGQRHARELDAARRLAAGLDLPLTVLDIALPWRGSSLLDPVAAPPGPPAGAIGQVIPSTYVPGRNLIFLAFALSRAEAEGAALVLIGANSVDFSGYPDCRPAFFARLNQVVAAGTSAGQSGAPPLVRAPFQRLSKAGIIRLGRRLGVPFAATWSCYAGARRPCGVCESCLLRARGFAAAGLADPLLHAAD